eukprot:TRINITY_DN854_c0_g1_i11.p3 TRINITY_DN854_c0_g1~~TRINITY_DN854_c0_g1_i11.p3  ORF type:complete len:197 (+),score=20.31 TRINITY_DN854_c0_g1_i11:26-592(+)
MIPSFVFMFLLATSSFCSARSLTTLVSSLPESSRLSVEQITLESSTISTGSPTNAGNRLQGGNVTDVLGLVPEQFGLNITQISEDNTALNEFQLNTQPDTNAGNILELGSITNSQVEVNMGARYNFAQSQDGMANAGNMMTVGNIFGNALNTNQGSVGNRADSQNGFANAGNVVNLSRRSLQSFSSNK